MINVEQCIVVKEFIHWWRQSKNEFGTTRLDNGTKSGIKQIWWKGVDWIQLANDNKNTFVLRTL
jgi:hypothetical protein